VAFECALSDEAARRDIGVGAVLLNGAVGNPGHSEVIVMLPAAEAAVRNGHWLGYHPYFPCHPDFAERWIEDEGRHHHMRALLSWDPVFVENGCKPRYLFTETGAIGAYPREDGRPAGYVSAGSGWRAPECLNGDRTRYYALLKQWRGMVADWNALNENRAEGAMLFTIGATWVGWDRFKLWKDDLDALRAVLS
jgi:hypothetical protein